MNALFVYGTLAPGRPNEHILSGLSGTWTDAILKARLIEDGWGAEMGYPGLVLDPDGSDVEGFVFQSDYLPAHWDRLDAFEGEAYERILCEPILAPGQVVSAYVYALRMAT